MNKAIPPSTREGAAVYSPVVLKLYDLWVLGVSNRWAWECPTREVLLPFFREHLSANHLDVGVGTGFYLKNSSLDSEQKVALLDLNPNSLEAARRAVLAQQPRLQPLVLQEDILRPQGALGAHRFDSMSLFYLLHCLPGTMSDKADAVFGALAPHLNPQGMIYGATLLGDASNHNGLGRRLMAVYNKKGIFSNRSDTAHDLQTALSRYFEGVSLRVHGRVALFCARGRPAPH